MVRISRFTVAVALAKSSMLAISSTLAMSSVLAVSLAMSSAPALAQAAREQPAPVKQAAKPADAPIMDRETAIEKANAYLNGASTMVADFVQIAADGRRSEGKLYVQRPGRMRFEYARPATLEIVADGTSVSIRDRKLATQDLYFIKQTPLKFLLKSNIDLSKDVKVLKVEGDPKQITITVEDKATFGGTSRIKLIFDPKTFSLKQWHVTDPQGYETLVSLFNIDLGRKPDSNLFVINTERMLSPN